MQKKERLLKKQQREALLLDSYLASDGLTTGRSLRDRKPVTYTFGKLKYRIKQFGTKLLSIVMGNHVENIINASVTCDSRPYLRPQWMVFLKFSILVVALIFFFLVLNTMAPKFLPSIDQPLFLN